MEKRLFIVSYRLPVAIDEENGMQVSLGGLVNALKGFVHKHHGHTFSKLYWAGYPGCNTNVWSDAIHKTAPGDFTYLPVFLNKPEYDDDEQFEEATHPSKYDSEDYQQVNVQFLHTLITHLNPGDMIWIHDHQLLLLPDLLRKEMPELAIGFFLHAPFPGQEELLKGVLGADLLAWHTRDDVGYFLQDVQLALGLEHDQHVLRHNNRLVKVDVFPVSTAYLPGFFTEITNIKKKQEDFKVKFLDTYSQKDLLDSYQHASNRLILLDYDGTLVPFSSKPADAVPGDDLLQLIKSLDTDRNTVCLISGRNREWLDNCLGYCQVNMIAEHGAFFKYQGHDWASDVLMQTDWIEPVKAIMKSHVRRCAHTFIEEKQFSVVWHYRNAGKKQGAQTAAELRTELAAFARDRHLKVAMGNKIVEVKNSAINKGEATRKILGHKQFDFILAIGDDYTDEDMFKALSGQKNCYTIKVGNEASYARYNLFTPHTVIALLENISHITVRDIGGRV